jgi:hypothetical protein
VAMTILLPLDVKYDRGVIEIAAHENGSIDLWRQDGEASCEVYLDLSLDWVSRATNELGQEAKVFHDDRRTAVLFAINLITDYHLSWAGMGLLTQVETAPPIIGRSNRGAAERYRQKGS